jgi:hypothetical protein
MEKNLTIKVDNQIVSLVNRIQKWEFENYPDKGDWSHWQWYFDESGTMATGFGLYVEYSVSIGASWVSVIRRNVGKYDNDNWVTHPFDTEYEEDK